MIGVKDTYYRFNNISLGLDKTFIDRLVPIYLIVATPGIIKYIKGCKLADHNKIVYYC